MVIFSIAVKTIIIGNSEALLTKRNGRIIDGFDYVVRMGNCRIKGYEHHVGTKTDMYRAVWKRHFFLQKDALREYIVFVNTELYGFTDLLLTEVKECDDYYETIPFASQNKYFTRQLFYDIPASSVTSTHKSLFLQNKRTRYLHDACLEYFVLHNPQVKNIFYYNKYKRIKLTLPFCRNNHTIVPSNGIFTIDHIVNTRSDDIYITGFDGFKTTYYWRDHETYFNSHSSVYEQLYLKNLVKQGRVRLLD